MRAFLRLGVRLTLAVCVPALMPPLAPALAQQSLLGRPEGRQAQPPPPPVPPQGPWQQPPPLQVEPQPPAQQPPAAQSPSSQQPPALESVPPPPPVIASWVARDTARVQVLDKVYARAATVTIKSGESARHGAIDIAVLSCFARPPDQAPDAASFLEVTEAGTSKALFRGWMFANRPALSMLEDPIYDVRIVACR